MAKFYVKYREVGKRPVSTAGEFLSLPEAEDFCSKLRAGSGGLFGVFHDVYVTDRATRVVSKKEKK